VSRTRSFPDGRRLGHFSEPEVREAGDVGSRHLDGGAAAEEAEEVTDAELGAPDAPSAFDVVASQMALEQVIDEADVISSVSAPAAKREAWRRGRGYVVACTVAPLAFRHHAPSFLRRPDQRSARRGRGRG